MLLLRIQGVPNLWLGRWFGCATPAIRYHLRKNSIPSDYPIFKLEILVSRQIGEIDAPRPRLPAKEKIRKDNLVSMRDFEKEKESKKEKSWWDEKLAKTKQ